MRLTLVLCLLPLAAGADPADTDPSATRSPAEVPAFARLLDAQAYDCRELTCGEIRSCEEACYKLTVCGHGRRDGDGDGIPCESLCSSRC